MCVFVCLSVVCSRFLIWNVSLFEYLEYFRIEYLEYSRIEYLEYSRIENLEYSRIEYLEYSRLFKYRERFVIKSWEHTTENVQTHKCKKLKLRPTPKKVIYQQTKMTGS